MEPITIIMLIFAAGLMLLSCFLPEKKNDASSEAKEELIAKLAKRELTAEEITRIEEQVDRIISGKTEEVILKTDDYLSKVANEKIMAVDDFSKQIMERLEKDNSDATFLYKMVSDAKDELKSEIEQARKERHSLEQLLEKEASGASVLLDEKKDTGRSAAKSSVRNTDKTEGVKKQDSKRRLTVPNNENEKRLQTRVVSQKDAGAEQKRKPESEITGQSEPDTSKTERELPKDRILELHKKGYSVREISKELSMGQGEVKLLIELYGA